MLQHKSTPHVSKSVGLAVVIAGFAALVFQPACSDDTSSSVSVKSFASSTVQSCDMEALPTTPESSHYPLECVSWEHVGNDIKINITNMHAGCDAHKHTASALWGPAGSGFIHLAITGSGSTAGCGWCAYDFSMTLSEVVNATGLVLTVASGPDDDSPRGGTMDISEEKGAICRYAPVFTFAEYDLGTPRLLCVAETEANERSCTDGATCVDVVPVLDSSYHKSYCLPSCENQTHCWDVEQCVEGLCRLTNAW